MPFNDEHMGLQIHMFKQIWYQILYLQSYEVAGFYTTHLNSSFIRSI